MIIDKETVKPTVPSTPYKPLHMSQAPLKPLKSHSQKRFPGLLRGKLTAGLVVATLLFGGSVAMASVPTDNSVSMVTSASMEPVVTPKPTSPVVSPIVAPSITPIATPKPTVAPVVKPAIDPCMDTPTPTETAMTADENEAFSIKCNEKVTGYISIPKLWNHRETVRMGTSSAVIGDTTLSGAKGIGTFGLNPTVGSAGRPYAITGHSGFGDVSQFSDVAKLVPGDIATIENSTGIYTYKFRSIEAVSPEDNSALEIPRFQEKDREAVMSKRSMIIVTCGIFANGEGDASIRRVAHFDYVGFTPAK